MWCLEGQNNSFSFLCFFFSWWYCCWVSTPEYFFSLWGNSCNGMRMLEFFYFFYCFIFLILWYHIDKLLLMMLLLLLSLSSFFVFGIYKIFNTIFWIIYCKTKRNSLHFFFGTFFLFLWLIIIKSKNVFVGPWVAFYCG